MEVTSLLEHLDLYHACSDSVGASENSRLVGMIKCMHP